MLNRPLNQLVIQAKRNWEFPVQDLIDVRDKYPGLGIYMNRYLQERAGTLGIENTYDETPEVSIIDAWPNKDSLRQGEFDDDERSGWQVYDYLRSHAELYAASDFTVETTAILEDILAMNHRQRQTAKSLSHTQNQVRKEFLFKLKPAAAVETILIENGFADQDNIQEKSEYYSVYPAEHSALFRNSKEVVLLNLTKLFGLKHLQNALTADKCPSLYATLNPRLSIEHPETLISIAATAPLHWSERRKNSANEKVFQQLAAFYTVVSLDVTVSGLVRLRESGVDISDPKNQQLYRRIDLEVGQRLFEERQLLNRFFLNEWVVLDALINREIARDKVPPENLRQRYIQARVNAGLPLNKTIRALLF